VPRIAAPTVALNREHRRAALLSAAATLILREGTFTVAEVATEVGLSRSAVYEYYSSAADLIADVLLDELADWSDALDAAVAQVVDPVARIDAWVSEVLEYVRDGRHALVRAAGSVDLPETRRSEVQARHRDLITPLTTAITDLGVADAPAVATLVWGCIDAAITRVESGVSTAERERALVLDFIRGGVGRVAAR
jgi:AcrR family transcriptional regulator